MHAGSNRVITRPDLRGRPKAHRLLAVFLAMVLCLTTFPPVTGQASPGIDRQSTRSAEQVSGPLPTSGPVIVGLKRGAVVPARTVAANSGARPTQVYQSVFRGFAANLPESAIRNLARNPSVAFIVADLPIYPAAQSTPTNLVRSGVHQSSLARIDGTDNVTNADIAIVDSGVNAHGDLRIAGGYNCTSTDRSAWGDSSGHGTHVAGTAAAIDNGDGVVGVAPGARIWSVKVLGASGGSTSNLICGLDWVAANSNTIDVVNMSLTGTNTAASTCTSGNDPLHTAVCGVTSRGIPIAVAAGNFNTDAGSTVPAKYDEVITTAAITDYNGQPGGGAARPGGCGEVNGGNGPDDFRAYYSNYGGVVDIAAPGTCVTSTTSNGGYGFMSGTSMASPMVAGALGLYKSVSPGSSADSARSWLFGSATRPYNSAEGYDGFPQPLLYLGSAQGPSNASGALNPTFPGFKAPIAYSGDDPHTGSSFLSYDNNLNTNWFNGRDSRPRASLTVDLGTTRDISGVKWKFDSLGFADRFTVSAVNTSNQRRTLGQFGNAPSAQTFHGVATNDTVYARYIVFEFTNINNDGSLGSISELEVWARQEQTALSPGTFNPTFAGFKAPIVYSGDSPHTGRSFDSYDDDLGSTWFSGIDYQPRASLTVDLGTTRDISGVKWKFHSLGFADQFTVAVANEAGGRRTLGQFGNAPYQQVFYGVGVSDTVLARYVVFEFTNINNDAALGSISELEVWAKIPGTASAEVLSASVEPTAPPTATPTPTLEVFGTPVASPVASPVPEDAASSVAASPDASPVPSPAESSFDATPAAETEEVVEVSRAAATPEALPTEEPTATPAPTEEPTATPTPTEEPTATPTPTEEPTATTEPAVEVATGVIVGTGGQGVRCRTEPSTESDVVATIAEGESVSVTGSEVDGWILVICGAGRPGYVSAGFVQIDGEPPPPSSTDSTDSTATAVEETETPPSADELAPTEAVPTEAPAETPYPIQRVVDSEESGIADQAVDDDPDTLWLVDPTVSPDEVWLLMDLGQVLPIDRISWELGAWNTLPTFEIWLSEDGETWWNASRIDGWNLEPDVEYEESLGLDARFVMIVVPNVEASGLSEIGGFREIAIWPADGARSLNVLGDPNTPEPPPTDVPTEIPAEEVIPETEEVLDDVPVEGEPAVEEIAPSDPSTDPAPDDTTEEPTAVPVP